MKIKLAILLSIIGIAAFGQDVNSSQSAKKNADTSEGLTTFGLSYSVNLPTGKTNDYIQKASFRGATVDFRYHLQKTFTIGISSGWYTFYEKKEYDTYTSGDNSLSASGVQYRYLNSVPVFFTADYYIKPDERVSYFI